MLLLSLVALNSQLALAQNGVKLSTTQSIVKIIATHNHPDFGSPWQRRGIHTVTGSGVIIDKRRILTNAHVVADQTLLEVQREGSGETYTADVEFVCHSCDLALLTVDDEIFFQNATPLELDGLPKLQSRVSVLGFPTGGETISITEGIVSRIEVDFYVHSSDRYLLVQVDAAINPGNSGGPVISDGKIVGIAMQALEHAENIGYIVPTPIIKHFLNDIKDGKFDGFPELDIYVQMLENPALRKAIKLPKGRSGLMITGIGNQKPLRKLLKPGDVLLEIDGYQIGRDGKVSINEGLRVESSHIEYLKQIGEKITLKLLRKDKTVIVDMPLLARKVRANNKQYDQAPTYYVFAGLVFQPLNNGYLKSHHSAQYNLMSYIPEYTLAGYKKIIPERITSKRKQEVILSRVLPDSVNQGYKDLEGAVVYSINGTEIKDIKHLAKTLDAATGKYLTIITDLGNMVVLDIAKAKKKHEKILENYQVYKDRSADLR